MGMIGKLHQKVTGTLNDQREALGKPRIDWGSVFNRPKPQVPRQPAAPYRARASWMERPYRERMK